MRDRVVITALLSATMFGVFAMAGPPPKSPASQWDGVYTEAQARRGEPLYTEYCGLCHGPDLLGGEMAPPLIGGTFQSNWHEQSLGDLFERVRTSMPLSAPGSLSRQQYADILAFLLSKDRYPTGPSELPAQSDALKETKFLASKP